MHSDLSTLSAAYDRLQCDLRQCQRNEQGKISIITKAQSDLLKRMREADEFERAKNVTI